MFGTGTACVVCPVEKIKYMGQTLDIPTMKETKVTGRFYKQLTDIQVSQQPAGKAIVIDNKNKR